MMWTFMAQGLLAETPQDYYATRYTVGASLPLLSQAKPRGEEGPRVTQLMCIGPKHHQTLPAVLFTWLVLNGIVERVRVA